jgi:hypothetical protein
MRRRYPRLLHTCTCQKLRFDWKTGAKIDSTTANEVLMKIPEYLKKTNYKNPENTNDGPFRYAMSTKLQYYDWLKTEPEQAIAFNTTMMLQRMDRGEA